jgi:tRNA (mo5U34)-methyltransferase
MEVASRALNPTAAPTAEDRQAVEDAPWYHTVDLPGGLTSKGWVDCRPVRSRVLVPDRLDGRKVLDVGTWDGFWAFELEERGGEVTTLDVKSPENWDWPPRLRIGAADVERREEVESTRLGEGFDLARRLRGSSVEQKRLTIYEVSPETVGKFDVVVVGSILLHLRDPVAALAAIRTVARGPVYLNEAIELIPTLLSPRTPRARIEGVDEVRWWQSNLATVEQFARSAGFEIVRRTRPWFVPLGQAHPMPGLRQQLRSLTSTAGREHLITWRLGIPHVSIELRSLD